MNYNDYYVRCRENYTSSTSVKLSNFYNTAVVKIPHLSFGEEYNQSINNIAKKAKEFFDTTEQDDIMLKCDDIWKYRDDLKTVCDILVPYLESERYGCHLYVDKIYLYRTTSLQNRQSSYLWHYDNNPLQFVKNLIYLNDVNEKNSPFEYLVDQFGNGVIASPTRTGPEHWLPAPNNSRIPQSVVDDLKSERGYATKKIVGKMGLTFSFNNNTIHRANPIKEGYRDVLNIRVRPCIKAPPSPIDPRWTTGFEKTGTADKNPIISWGG